MRLDPYNHQPWTAGLDVHPSYFDFTAATRPFWIPGGKGLAAEAAMWGKHEVRCCKTKMDKMIGFYVVCREIWLKTCTVIRL